MKKTNMKKFLLLFCMLACVFSMTACSDPISSDSAKESVKDQKVASVKDDMENWATDMIGYLNSSSDDQIKSDAENANGLDKIEGKDYVVNPDGMNTNTIEFYNGWAKTKDDLGELKSIDNINVKVSAKTSELCSIIVDSTYENRKCSFEFVVDKDMKLVSGAINPVYTTGEKMEKAVLNTILGMGTVFIVLIFISFVIAQLKHLNKIGQPKTEAKQSTAQTQGVDNAISQIVSAEENEADDLELVAVITAAIAAAEGTSTDGLVVRSIKRVNKSNNWRR